MSESKTQRRACLLAAAIFLALVLGFVFGSIWKGSAGAPGTHGNETSAQDEPATTWTCSMHPQIQQPKPGACPLCAMDLIPMGDDAAGNPRELSLSPAAQALADIQVHPVERRTVTRQIRLSGTVDYDETRLATISARVGGRLDRMFVDYTGVTVREGDHMVWMYSPEILAAQEALIQAKKAVTGLPAGQPTMVHDRANATLAAARDKLRLWGLSQAQVATIENQAAASDHIQLNAPMGGVVIHKNGIEGMYVKTGTPIYRIADLSQLWIKLDAYESDLAWLRYGQTVTFTTEAYPAETFAGRISFIDPVLTANTRTVKVRVNVANANGKLKPGMFVRAVVEAALADSGNVMDPSLAGKWISPMHPEIVKDQPGTCDVCGMALVKAETLGLVAEPTPQMPLVIPATAPLVTGKRAVVYVQNRDNRETFEGREVALGPRAGDHYVVNEGLTEGELVVVNGAFKIDSALQLQGRPSMMSAPEGSHKEGSHKEGSHKEGSHKEGSHKEGSHKEGSHKEGSHDE